jgi:hypothetical protein
VSRIWRHLAGLRRSGQAHGIDELVPHRRPNSITIRCPCCPEVGLNVELEVIENASEDEAYVSLTLALSKQLTMAATPSDTSIHCSLQLTGISDFSEKENWMILKTSR